jgi:hypothetical protein
MNGDGGNYSTLIASVPTEMVTGSLPLHLGRAILALGTAFKSGSKERVALLHLKCADIGDGMVDAR